MAGLVIVVAAIPVAVDRMVWIIFSATAANVAIVVWQLRALHRSV